MNTSILKRIAWASLIVIAMILLTDAIFFAIWVASGQTPPDQFYLGSITGHILSAIL